MRFYTASLARGLWQQNKTRALAQKIVTTKRDIYKNCDLCMKITTA
jgi:hypothetical protein